MRTLICLLVTISLAGCQRAPRPSTQTTTSAATAPTTVRPVEAWAGIYTSPSEIRGYSSTVLRVDGASSQGIFYRMRSRSDVSLADAIAQDELFGRCLIEGDALYLPRAYGFMGEGTPSLHATIDRYTMVEINGRQVLMRDDALKVYREQNKLYDYGILIKVQDGEAGGVDLSKVPHPPIKSLYADPTKPWNDPFVHGANER